MIQVISPAGQHVFWSWASGSGADIQHQKCLEGLKCGQRKGLLCPWCPSQGGLGSIMRNSLKAMEQMVTGHIAAGGLWHHSRSGS